MVSCFFLNFTRKIQVVSDKELYFCLPYDILDLLLYARVNNIPQNKVGEVLNLKEEQIRRVFKDFDLKKQATDHLRQLPPTLE